MPMKIVLCVLFVLWFVGLVHAEGEDEVGEADLKKAAEEPKQELAGWQIEQARYEKLVASLPESVPTVKSYWRSPTELWIYDARAELGIGVHVAGPEHLDMIRRIGMRFVRKTMYWYLVENTTQPGVYSEERLRLWDEFVKSCNEKGIELLILVSGNAPGTGWDNRHESYERFAEFVSDMVERYPNVRYWELWNEMDEAFTDLFGKDQPELTKWDRGKCYAEMLKIAYPAIKAVNPDAWVVMGGMVGWDEFPQGVYDNGGRNCFDIMNLHTYGLPVEWGFLGRGHLLHELMKEYDDGDKPIWNTEFGLEAGSMVEGWGYPHENGKNDGEFFDQTHLNTWKTCIEVAQKSGLYQKYMPYQFHAKNESGPERLKTKEYAQKHLAPGLTIEDYGCGLVRSDGITPRPTYHWLLENRPNLPISRQPIRIMDVCVPYSGNVPREHGYEIQGATITIKDVRIDSLEPTRIFLCPKNGIKQ